MPTRVLLFATALFLSALTPLRAQEPANAPETRNLILMIGDGMGPTQVQVAAEFADRTLAMQSLPVRGSLKTFAANNPVTDSAAAGTALACGHKTNNGVLGQLPDKTKLVSIAELARDAGKRVGVLSSVPLNHATPAAFYAKVDSRGSYYDIGLQALASRFDLLGGNNLSDAEGGNVQPRPAKSLWQLAEESGRKVLRTPAELRSHGAGDGPALIVPKSLYSQAGLPYARPFDVENDLTLAQVTSKALELLDNPDGFFLMVEGGAIDWAGHANDLLANIGETLAFDEAVAVAKVFAESHPGTLLVVTSDHETGGLSRQEGHRPETARAILSHQATNRGDLVDWLRKHVKEAEQTTDAGWAAASSQFRTVLGLAPVLPLTDVERLYRKVFEAPDKERGKAVETVVHEALKLRDAAAGLKWTTGGHTATDVPLFALGTGAERFEGSHDNTQVPRLSAELLRLPLP